MQERTISLKNRVGPLFQLLLGCAVLCTLFGCSFEQSLEAPATPVKMRFSWWSNEQRSAAFLEAVSLYRQQVPEIEIETNYLSENNFYYQLKTQLAGNTAPDIVIADPKWRSNILIRANFCDLSLPQYSSLLDTSGIHPDQLQALGYIEDALVGIPLWLDCICLVSNMDILHQYYDHSYVYPSTWEEFISAAKDFEHLDLKESFYFCSDPEMLVDGVFIPYLNQKCPDSWVNDNYKLQFRKQDVLDALSIIEALYSVEYRHAALPIGQAAPYNGKLYRSPAWRKGRVLWVLGRLTDTHLFQTDDFDQEVTSLPSVAGIPQTEITGILACVNQQSEQIRENIIFINWLINDETAIETLGFSCGYPANQRAVQHLRSKGITNSAMERGITTTLNSSFTTPVIQGNSELRAICESTVAKVAYHQTDVETASQEFYDSVYNKVEELFYNTRS